MLAAKLPIAVLRYIGMFTYKLAVSATVSMLLVTVVPVTVLLSKLSL